MSDENLKKEIEKLKADKKKPRDIYFKVSQKGAVSTKEHIYS